MNIKFADNVGEKSDKHEENVEGTSPLKEILINYVGEKNSPENDEVTVSMIVEAVAEEFPEFLMLVAEENWVRGYQQALNDVVYGETLAKEEKEDIIEAEQKDEKLY